MAGDAFSNIEGMGLSAGRGAIQINYLYRWEYVALPLTKIILRSHTMVVRYPYISRTVKSPIKEKHTTVLGPKGWSLIFMTDFWLRRKL